MEDTDARSLSQSGDDRNDTAALAAQIISRMQEQKTAPTLALLVECIEEVREQLPDTFDEQISLLRVLEEEAALQLTRAGKGQFIRDLQEITGYLDQCGEVPGYSFGVIIERSQVMEPYAAGLYLEGIEGLAHVAQWRGPERHLIALFAGVDDPDAPFAWSDRERKLFTAMVERHEASVAGLVGVAPVVREEQPAAAYQADASVPPVQIPVDAGRRGLRWNSTLVLLVYFSDLFRKTGLIDPLMTDAEIIASCEFDRFKREDARNLTDIQRAVRYFYLLRMGYAAKVKSHHFSVTPTDRPPINLLRLEEDLSAAHLRLSRVYIENLPYEKLIPRHDREGTFFYLDPPYHGFEDDYGKDLFSADDFKLMAEMLAGIDGKFLMSINDTEFIRKTFRRFTIEEVETRWNASPSKKKVTELVIRNYSH